MDVQEAFSILGISKESTSDEIKSKYKELAKKHHPDVSKAPDANDVFKKINEAHKVAQDFKAGKYKQNIGHNNAWQKAVDDLFNNGPFRRTASPNLNPPEIKVKISFEESVLGCIKTINYNRFVKCDSCGGRGICIHSNGCSSCDGYGQSVSINHNMMISSPCQKCFGKDVKREDCSPCYGEGVVKTETSASVNIPAGVKNGQMLKLRGCGNFIINSFVEGYSDAHLNVDVEKNDFMEINNKDIISNINITLLEALTGHSLKFKTVYGEIDLNIPPASKNKDCIPIKGYGVKGTDGSHKFIVNINYPNNIDKLIESLKNLES